MLCLAFWRDCLEVSREEGTRATSVAILAEVRECERGQAALGRKFLGEQCSLCGSIGRGCYDRYCNGARKTL